MHLLIVLFGIALLLALILLKLSPMIALLVVAIVTGLLLGLPVSTVMTSVTNGIGSTLGGMVMVLALGAMMGKMIEDSGVARKIVLVLIRRFGRKNIQWAILLTGFLVGIPLFYNAGFVVLIPLVFAIAATTNLPLLYVGIPMAASLSVTHGFLPPHPGPIALATIFRADIGKTLLYGLSISIPIAIIAGIVFPRLIIRQGITQKENAVEMVEDESHLPGALKSFVIALMPVILIAAGSIGLSVSANSVFSSFFIFLSDPTVALLTAVLVTILLQKMPISQAMQSSVEGVKSIAMIILIIAAGGAFKQILVDSGIGTEIKQVSTMLKLSPLFLGWLITALLRVTLGSATVAALTASGIVVPFIQEGASPELMVLSVGAGSLFFSHVNDTGFWMFKEYFKLNLRQTFGTWTIMESIISILGLVGVLTLEAIFF
jgi:Gnt-I system high-affinity gluconate transporter